MSGCSSAAAAASMTSFSNLLSSSSATRRAPNFLCSALETQTGVSRFIGGDFASPWRNLSPLVCVRRNLVGSLPSSLAQSSQIELEPIIEGRSQLSDEDNLRTVCIKIQLRKECLFGEKFFIVGAQPDLGLWNPLDAVPMTWSDDHLWTAELVRSDHCDSESNVKDIPLGEPVQFKLILREISGKFLWQPGKDRVLHTWETCNIISVIEDWEDAEAQQVSEERVVNNECEKSDLMETKVKQLQHSDEKYNDEETYESSEFADSFVCSSHEIVATAANNTSHDSYTDMESTAEICGDQVKDESVTLHADKDEDEEQVKVEHDVFNIVSDKNADTHTLEEQVKEHWEELEKVNGRSVTFNEGQNEIAAPDNDEDVNHCPDQDLDSVFSELPSNKESDPWSDEIKWGQKTLKRFLNNFGFL
ncbi:hypothetical protein V2J09_006641 [Rumex salicifolius]